MINFAVNEEIRKIKITGELDVAAEKDFKKALECLAQSPGDILVDMGGVEFVDASGLRPLIELSDNMEGRIIILNPSHFAQKVLGLVRNGFIVEE